MKKFLITCFLIVASVSFAAEPLSFYSLDSNKATIKFGDLVYGDCSHRMGSCILAYKGGRAHKEAQRWGFFLPQLPVQLKEFEGRTIVKVAQGCASNLKWRNNMWKKVVNEIRDAGEIKLFGEKFRRSVVGHLYLDDEPLIHIMEDIAMNQSC